MKFKMTEAKMQTNQKKSYVSIIILMKKILSYSTRCPTFSSLLSASSCIKIFPALN